MISKHFIYYWTDPWDIVVDPMAGGGTTEDVCKKFFRRYQVYDINPLKTRQNIVQYDITKGYPEKAKGCKAIFLDPPYWHMKDSNYKKGSASGLTREEFIAFISKLAVDSFQVLKKGGILGFLFQSIAPPVEGLYKGPKPLLSIELAFQFILAGFEGHWEIPAPLSNQQYDGTKVNLAKKKKVPVHVNRMFYVFKKQ